MSQYPHGGVGEKDADVDADADEADDETIDGDVSILLRRGVRLYSVASRGGGPDDGHIHGTRLRSKDASNMWKKCAAVSGSQRRLYARYTSGACGWIVPDAAEPAASPAPAPAAEDASRVSSTSAPRRDAKESS